jgi:hypothetical protein
MQAIEAAPDRFVMVVNLSRSRAAAHAPRMTRHKSRKPNKEPRALPLRHSNTVPMRRLRD